MYEPDESPDGFPLEYGNIIVGLPKDQANPSKPAADDQPSTAEPTGPSASAAGSPSTSDVNPEASTSATAHEPGDAGTTSEAPHEPQDAASATDALHEPIDASATPEPPAEPGDAAATAEAVDGSSDAAATSEAVAEPGAAAVTSEAVAKSGDAASASDAVDGSGDVSAAREAVEESADAAVTSEAVDDSGDAASASDAVDGSGDVSAAREAVEESADAAVTSEAVDESGDAASASDAVDGSGDVSAAREAVEESADASATAEAVHESSDAGAAPDVVHESSDAASASDAVDGSGDTTATAEAVGEPGDAVVTSEAAHESSDAGAASDVVHESNEGNDSNEGDGFAGGGESAGDVADTAGELVGAAAGGLAVASAGHAAGDSADKAADTSAGEPAADSADNASTQSADGTAADTAGDSESLSAGDAVTDAAGESADDAAADAVGESAGDAATEAAGETADGADAAGDSEVDAADGSEASAVGAAGESEESVDGSAGADAAVEAGAADEVAASAGDDASGESADEVSGESADDVAGRSADDAATEEAATDESAGDEAAGDEAATDEAAGDEAVVSDAAVSDVVGDEDGGGGQEPELTGAQLAEKLAAEQAAMALITALMKLRGVLAGSRLPLEVVGADEARQQQKAMLDQLDDYLLPRLVQLEAPILAVVGGSTGAGKSTLVNTVIGKVVSEPGVLRPTTRSPVLIHHPADADWFVGDRVLPGMVRTNSDEPGGMEDAGQLRLVAADTVPRGLAILDAPDIDSVVEANRDLATQLLAAADLWLFVTTAARYSDAVPWEFLQSASDRSTAVAVVLDRAPRETIDDITGHLAQMLLERGLGDSPLFSIQETVVDGNGMLPQPSVASIKDWLIDLAADAEARAAVVRRTLQGAVSAMVKKAPPFAAAVKAQAETAIELRSSVEAAYDQGVKDIAKACQDGTLLRGEVLARWQEFVGTGELLKGLQSNAGRLRDRLKSSLGNKPAETRDVSHAIQSGLESLLREHATAAAERAEKTWQASAPGRQLLTAAEANLARDSSAEATGGTATTSSRTGSGTGSRSGSGGRGSTSSRSNGGAGNGAGGNSAGNSAGDGGPSLGAMSEQFPAAASRAVRDWQEFVLDLVRKEGADKKSTARILEYGVNGIGLSLMVVVFASGAGIPKGAQASVGAGSAVVGQRLLEAVFGDKAVQGMVDKAREDLDGKVHALMDAEFARYLAVLDQHPVDAETARQLTEAARAVEDCT
ncbi:AAA family ATPase [Kribbella sp. NPDC004875]|uniref:AAA family ATPase n=1 Tax=Kribbella sp. NPDC004875 TaxID=3364107 RepID=UPI0036954CB6